MAEADAKVKDAPKKKKGLPALLVPLLACVLGAAAGGAGAAIAVLKFAPGLTAGGGAHTAAAAPHDPVPEGPLEYVEVDNAFTSNLADSGRYLQIKISLSTFGGPTAVESIEKHKPALVSAVLAALGEVREPDIESAKAKDELRERLKGVINSALKSKGEPGGVEEVFFTSLVVQ
jgi:flagellar basal body-associated protein FliL